MHVGTYNNQYILVDLNKFRPGAELQPGLLTIVEQMPGYCEAGDLTQVRKGEAKTANVYAPLRMIGCSLPATHCIRSNVLHPRSCKLPPPHISRPAGVSCSRQPTPT